MCGGIDYGEDGPAVAGGENPFDEFRVSTVGRGEFREVFGVGIGETSGDGCIRGIEAKCFRKPSRPFFGDRFETVGGGDFRDRLGGGIEFVAGECGDQSSRCFGNLFGSQADTAVDGEGVFRGLGDVGEEGGGGDFWRGRRIKYDVSQERYDLCASVGLFDSQAGVFEGGGDGGGIQGWDEPFRTEDLTGGGVVDAPDVVTE